MYDVAGGPCRRGGRGTRGADAAALGPLVERHLGDELGAHPAQAAGAAGELGDLAERAHVGLQGAQLRRDRVQQPLVEAGPHGAGEVQPAVVVVHPDEQRPERAGAVALAHLVAADHHLLLVAVLHLHPRRRAPAGLVRRVAPLGDDPLEPVGPGRRQQRLGIVAHRRDRHRRHRVEHVEQFGAPLRPRLAQQAVTVELEQVEGDERVRLVGAADELERVPPVVAEGDHLPVEHEVVVPLDRRPQRCRQPRPTVGARLARGAHHVDGAATHPHDRPVTVPLRLVHPLVTQGQRREVRLHRRHRPADAHALGLQRGEPSPRLVTTLLGRRQLRHRFFEVGVERGEPLLCFQDDHACLGHRRLALGDRTLGRGERRLGGGALAGGGGRRLALRLLVGGLGGVVGVRGTPPDASPRPSSWSTSSRPWPCPWRPSMAPTEDPRRRRDRRARDPRRRATRGAATPSPRCRRRARPGGRRCRRATTRSRSGPPGRRCRRPRRRLDRSVRGCAAGPPSTHRRRCRPSPPLGPR